MSKVLVDKLLDEAFAVLQHDTGEQNEEYRWQRDVLREKFATALKARAQPAEVECVEAFDLCDGSGARVVYEDDHVAALSAVTTERDALRERVTELSSGTVDPADVCAIEEELNRLRALINECSQYLNTDRETSISSGSILHRKMIAALAAKEDV